MLRVILIMHEKHFFCDSLIFPIIPLSVAKCNFV